MSNPSGGSYEVVEVLVPGPQGVPAAGGGDGIIPGTPGASSEWRTYAVDGGGVLLQRRDVGGDDAAWENVVVLSSQLDATAVNSLIETYLDQHSSGGGGGGLTVDTSRQTYVDITGLDDNARFPFPKDNPILDASNAVAFTGTVQFVGTLTLNVTDQVPGDRYTLVHYLLGDFTAYVTASDVSRGELQIPIRGSIPVTLGQSGNLLRFQMSGSWANGRAHDDVAHLDLRVFSGLVQA